MIHNGETLEKQMRDLVESGVPLGDVIRTMFHKGYGKLLLCEPVMKIADVDSIQAKRIVIRETGE